MIKDYMPTVRFLPSGNTIEVRKGTRLYDAARSAGLPVASSCDGQATCGKCNMTVVAGKGGVSPSHKDEAELLRKEGKPATDRISCITRVDGDCTVTTTYW